MKSVLHETCSINHVVNLYHNNINICSKIEQINPGQFKPELDYWFASDFDPSLNPERSLEMQKIAKYSELEPNDMVLERQELDRQGVEEEEEEEEEEYDDEDIEDERIE
jgi:hypothetical protein